MKRPNRLPAAVLADLALLDAQRQALVRGALLVLGAADALQVTEDGTILYPEPPPRDEQHPADPA